jgi:hypothetical protein
LFCGTDWCATARSCMATAPLSDSVHPQMSSIHTGAAFRPSETTLRSSSAPRLAQYMKMGGFKPNRNRLSQPSSKPQQASRNSRSINCPLHRSGSHRHHSGRRIHGSCCRRRRLNISSYSDAAAHACDQSQSNEISPSAFAIIMLHCLSFYLPGVGNTRSALATTSLARRSGVKF